MFERVILEVQHGFMGNKAEELLENSLIPVTPKLQLSVREMIAVALDLQVFMSSMFLKEFWLGCIGHTKTCYIEFAVQTKGMYSSRGKGAMCCCR